MPDVGVQECADIQSPEAAAGRARRRRRSWSAGPGTRWCPPVRARRTVPPDDATPPAKASPAVAASRGHCQGAPCSSHNRRISSTGTGAALPYPERWPCLSIGRPGGTPLGNSARSRS